MLVCHARPGESSGSRAGAVGKGTYPGSPGDGWFRAHQGGITFLFKCSSKSTSSRRNAKWRPRAEQVVPSQETGKLEGGNAIINPQAAGGGSPGLHQAGQEKQIALELWASPVSPLRRTKEAGRRDSSSFTGLSYF